MIWLLRIVIAGRTWYLASRSCEPERAGVELPHHGALTIGGFAEGLDLSLGSIVGSCSMSATLHTGDVEGWRLARDGHTLDGSIAEVALWEPGTPYAAREVLLRGYVTTGGDVPRDGDPIEIEITGALVDDAATWPDPDDVTTTDAWPSIPDDADDFDQTGLPYPMPIGEMGTFLTASGDVKRASTVQVIIVDATAGAEVGVVAGAPIADVTVKIWNDTTKDSADFTVLSTPDGNGVVRATVDFSGAPVGWLFDGTHTYYITDLDEGLVGDRSTGSPTTLGEMMIYLLNRRYGDIGLSAVDLGGWTGIADQLAGWLVGLMPEPGDPLQIISDELMPLCPALSIVPGPRGQRPVYLAATGRGRKLIVGRDLFRRDDPGTWTDVDICNQMAVNFADSAYAGKLRSRITVGPDEHPEAAISQMTYGLQADTLDSKATWARGTAGLSAGEHIRMRCRRRLLLTYDAPMDVIQALALGDRIRLVDDARDFSERAAWVASRAVDETADMGVVGLLLV